MIIRCKGCQSTVWLQSIDTSGGVVSVSCRRCGQRYEFPGWTKKDLLDRRLGEGARALARDEEIDLAGAYSVLLGIMTAAQVRELQRAGRPAEEEPSPDEPDSSDHRLSYDRAFHAAVEAGFLTPRQAKERGSRQAYAAMLASQHGLPESLSYEVADNRTPLLEALRRGSAADFSPLAVTSTARRKPWRAVALVAVLLALVAALAFLRNAGDSPVGAALETSAGSAVLLTDSEGRVLQVRAADPRAVLEAFCSVAAEGERFTAVHLSAQEPAGSVLGLLRDSARPSELLAIPIRESSDLDRWVSGNGRSPLMPELAPPGVSIRGSG